MAAIARTHRESRFRQQCACAVRLEAEALESTAVGRTGAGTLGKIREETGRGEVHLDYRLSLGVTAKATRRGRSLRAMFDLAPVHMPSFNGRSRCVADFDIGEVISAGDDYAPRTADSGARKGLRIREVAADEKDTVIASECPVGIIELGVNGSHGLASVAEFPCECSANDPEAKNDMVFASLALDPEPRSLDQAPRKDSNDRIGRQEGGEIAGKEKPRTLRLPRLLHLIVEAEKLNRAVEIVEKVAPEIFCDGRTAARLESKDTKDDSDEEKDDEETVAVR
ncbi:hypothetical protein WGR33_20340 (plasmid) [Sinorhizobium meliloti]